MTSARASANHDARLQQDRLRAEAWRFAPLNRTTLTLDDYVAGKLAYVSQTARADIADTVRFLRADEVEGIHLRAATRLVADRIAANWTAIEHPDGADAATAADTRRAARAIAQRIDRAGVEHQVAWIFCLPEKRTRQMSLIARAVDQHRRAGPDLVVFPAVTDDADGYQSAI